VTNNSGYILPDKLYFRIGEVSDIVGVKPYVLRYWETEFSDIKPTKSKSGQRLYKKRDVELLLRVKELLYEEGFTISGAKQRLKEFGKQGPAPAVVVQEEVTVETDNVEVASDAKAKKVVSGSDKKFLEKLKKDLEWCLAELSG